MNITKIISSGAFGAESAALDVAIRLKIPYGGYAPEGSLLDEGLVFRRYKLWEKPFPTAENLAEANLGIADGTLIFTRGAPGPLHQSLIDWAAERDHPCLHIDFDHVEPLQAAFRISVWASTHAIESLFVTGAGEDQGNYQSVYEWLHSALMLGKEEYPVQELPATERDLVPKTVDEAVQFLIEELPLKDKVTIANMTADDLAEINLSLGNHIRNKFGLWNGNTELMESCAESALRDELHPDQASAVIIALLALELQKTHKLSCVTRFAKISVEDSGLLSRKTCTVHSR